MAASATHATFHRLNRQRQRVSAIRLKAIVMDRRDIVVMAEGYAKRLAFWAKRWLPGDAPHVAGMIGPNGIGPAIDDLSRTVRIASQAQRRAQQNREMLDQQVIDRAVAMQPHVFSSGHPHAGEPAASFALSPAAGSTFRKVA